MSYLTIHLTPDNYLIAAERGVYPRSYFYHPDCEDCEVETVDVAESSACEAITDALVTQGTSDQVYSDGYVAYDRLLQIIIHHEALPQEV